MGKNISYYGVSFRNTYVIINGMIIFILMTTLISCRKFLDVELTRSRISVEKVFHDENMATSAVTGIYNDMVESNIYGGSTNSLSRLTGLSADELKDFRVRAGIIEFETNELTADNTNLLTIWNDFYRVIYDANAVIEGLAASNELRSEIKNQLTGEARFIRAFCHFYLLNLYGDIPLITNTNYTENALAARTARSEVYEQIVSDLEYAQANLSENYITSERTRVNKATASALLARVYLYEGDWSNAEIQSSSVINNINYQLLANPDQVFLKNSKEAIWQLGATHGTYNTSEAVYYILTATPTYLILRNEFPDSFESGDLRKSKWVGSFTSGSNTWYYPYKYKIRIASQPITEYLMVFRLAEQYLIRAESRAQLNNNSGAQSDINAIRNRAGLANTTASDKTSLLAAIELERKNELFTEWGHRWFDLKRWNRATAVLGAVKQGWNIEDVLYPLPQTEMDRNPNLKPQNPGY